MLIAEAMFAGLLDDVIEVQLSTGSLTVVSRAGLTKMKQLAGRKQDLADLAKLEGDHDE